MVTEHDACPHQYSTTTKLISFHDVPGNKLCSRFSPDLDGLVLAYDKHLLCLRKVAKACKRHYLTPYVTML